MALNRRWEEKCWYSCWGPDEKSCDGLQFIDPTYPTFFWEADAHLIFEGTDVLFKGAEAETEMSVSAWVYTLDVAENRQYWRFRAAGYDDQLTGAGN